MATFKGRYIRFDTRWAPTVYKWSYNPYQWPYKWATRLITLIIGVITPVITGKWLGKYSHPMDPMGLKRLNTAFENAMETTFLATSGGPRNGRSCHKWSDMGSPYKWPKINE